MLAEDDCYFALTLFNYQRWIFCRGRKKESVVASRSSNVPRSRIPILYDAQTFHESVHDIRALQSIV